MEMMTDFEKMFIEDVSHKTIEEKISTIEKYLENGNPAIWTSSVHSCLEDCRTCLSRIENPGNDITSEEWKVAANDWIERAAQHCWGFSRPKVW